MDTKTQMKERLSRHIAASFEESLTLQVTNIEPEELADRILGNRKRTYFNNGDIKVTVNGAPYTVTNEENTFVSSSTASSISNSSLMSPLISPFSSALVFDVREEEDYRNGHVTGAIFMPFSSKISQNEDCEDMDLLVEQFLRCVRKKIKRWREEKKNKEGIDGCNCNKTKNDCKGDEEETEDECYYFNHPVVIFTSNVSPDLDEAAANYYISNSRLNYIEKKKMKRLNNKKKSDREKVKMDEESFSDCESDENIDIECNIKILLGGINNWLEKYGKDTRLTEYN